MTQAPTRIRHMGEDDVGFVVHSWRANYSKHASVPDKRRKCDMSTMSRQELCERAASLECKLRGVAPARCTQPVYRQEQTALIADVLQRDKAMALVAEWDGEDPCLQGFIVYEIADRPVLHYIYVKESWRKAGIGTKLLAAMRSDVGDGPYWCSHWTRYVPKLGGVIGVEVEFNPYRRFCYAVGKSVTGGVREANAITESGPSASY